MGYKGVVAVDREMDRVNGKRREGEDPIHMRLRPSMRKFDNKKLDVADIEIAQAFRTPNVCYLNRYYSGPIFFRATSAYNLPRPLVMLLEDLGAKRDAFIQLQDMAVADARTIDGGILEFWRFISGHGLGNPFRLKWILQRFRDLGLDILSSSKSRSIDTPFLHLLRSVAITDVLRDIKHSARIPIPESYLLVGIADEGVAYQKAGKEDVFTLEENQIYGKLCSIQSVLVS